MGGGGIVVDVEGAQDHARRESNRAEHQDQRCRPCRSDRHAPAWCEEPANRLDAQLCTKIERLRAERCGATGTAGRHGPTAA